jgi:deoxycytidine triphosphate deaminase
VNSAIIDPKAFDERSFVSVQADSVIVPPNSFALARSIEYFRIPRDVLTICVGKSTYARCGIIVNVTPFEPEWEGFVTLEISNTTLPAKVYANEGLCQILFFRSDEDPAKSAMPIRKGKYIRTSRELCFPSGVLQKQRRSGERSSQAACEAFLEVYRSLFFCAHEAWELLFFAPRRDGAKCAFPGNLWPFFGFRRRGGQVPPGMQN